MYLLSMYSLEEGVKVTLVWTVIVMIITALAVISFPFSFSLLIKNRNGHLNVLFEMFLRGHYQW